MFRREMTLSYNERFSAHHLYKSTDAHPLGLGVMGRRRLLQCKPWIHQDICPFILPSYWNGVSPNSVLCPARRGGCSDDFLRHRLHLSMHSNLPILDSPSSALAMHRL